MYVEPKNHKCEDQSELTMVPLNFGTKFPRLKMAKNSFDDGQTWVVPRENKTNGLQLYLHDKNLSNLIFQRGCG